MNRRRDLLIQVGSHEGGTLEDGSSMYMTTCMCMHGTGIMRNGMRLQVMVCEGGTDCESHGGSLLLWIQSWVTGSQGLR